MWAAAEGHAAVVEALLHAGADLRTPLPSGFTPLFFAVREGRLDVVRVLLKAGADVNEAMQPGRASGRAPAKGTSPLILAVENGHFQLAVALLEAGADPNDQRSGVTALHTLTWVRKPSRGDDENGDPAPDRLGEPDQPPVPRRPREARGRRQYATEARPLGSGCPQPGRRDRVPPGGQDR